MSSNAIDDRATRLGEYIVENKATVRCAARQFGVSKSTVHMAVTKQSGCPGRPNKSGHEKAHICRGRYALFLYNWTYPFKSGHISNIGL